MVRPARIPLPRAALAAALAAVWLPASAAPASYGAQHAAEICGFLPYRALGPARFDSPRTVPDVSARIGDQATYPFAWDLARPGFLAAEIADDLIAGLPADQVRHAHDAGLSLGEYMLHAAGKFAAPPAPPASDDLRVSLAAERPKTFHLIYAHAKESFDRIAGAIALDAPPATDDELAAIAASWRPAYALVAKAQADDKRIELLDTSLDADSVLEKEAEACLAHAVTRLADGAGADRPQAAAARWAKRPSLDVRALDRNLRVPVFDYEDAGDDLAAEIAALPPGPVDLDAMRGIAKAYAAYIAAAKSLIEARRAQTGR